MTTVNDDLKDRQQRFGTGAVDTTGTVGDAYADPSKAFPRQTYQGESSVNKAARGGAQHTLNTGSGVSMPSIASTQYGKADIKETAHGHVLEFNDTPAGERILIKHANGSGVEFRPDGTILIVSSHNTVQVCHGDNTVVVEGDATLNYKGNLTLNVDGDYNVNCDNYKVNVGGNKKEDIKGASRTKVFGNSGYTVSGNSSTTVVGTTTNTHLGNTTTAVKGSFRLPVEGDIVFAASGTFGVTAEGSINQASPDINIAATNLSVFGNTGTIGGENIIMYNYNMYTGKSVYSETMTTNVVYGDLSGTAAQAVSADTAESQSYEDSDPGGDTGTSPGYTVDTTGVDTKVTALPNADLLTSYLTQSGNGVRKVLIDVDDHLKNTLRVQDQSGPEVRAALRDEANLNNPEFTAAAVGAGTLNPNFAASSPPGGYGRSRPAGGNCQRGTTPVGNATPDRATKTFRVPNQQSVFSFSPTAEEAGLIEADETPEEAEAITAAVLAEEPNAKGPDGLPLDPNDPYYATDEYYDSIILPPRGGSVEESAAEKAARHAKIEADRAERNEAQKQRGLSSSERAVAARERLIGTNLNSSSRVVRKFVGRGNGNFNDLNLQDRRDIARNYIAHKHVTRAFLGIDGKYRDHNLKVVEAFYSTAKYGQGGPGGVEEEILTPGGMLDLRSKGRLVVYELYNSDGKLDAEATFDLATDIAEIGIFDKLILDYDTFNPNGSMNVQLIIEMPQITNTYKATFKQEVETRFNNKLQAHNALTEMLPDQSNPTFGPQ